MESAALQKPYLVTTLGTFFEGGLPPFVVVYVFQRFFGCLLGYESLQRLPHHTRSGGVPSHWLQNTSCLG